MKRILLALGIIALVLFSGCTQQNQENQSEDNSLSNTLQTESISTTGSNASPTEKITAKKDETVDLCAGLSCSDNNPCTIDSCSVGVCSHSNSSNGAICGTNEECVAGECVEIDLCADRNCDDSNPCTTDYCIRGTCSHPSVDDNHNCGSNKECKSGQCTEIPITLIQETPNPEPTYTCAYNAYNCGDFATHAKAQAVFEACGGTNNDIHGLD